MSKTALILSGDSNFVITGSREQIASLLKAALREVAV